MFFAGIPPETLKKITEIRRQQQKKPKPTFEKYYHKRLMEEYGDYIKNPKFSGKCMFRTVHIHSCI